MPTNEPEGIPVTVTMTERGARIIAQQTSETAYDAALTYATERGRQDGTNAAGWYTMDTIGGRVSRAEDAQRGARAIIAGIEDGDPAVLDTFPAPDLSGERADSLTSSDLTRDAWAAAGIAPEDQDGYEDATDICDAYETAFSDAVENEIARAAREVLA